MREEETNAAGNSGNRYHTVAGQGRLYGSLSKL